jgi:YggT family protein
VSVVFGLVWLLLTIYFVLLLARLVLDWVQVFSRDWTPRGPVLVVAEVVYTATDPPLRAVRKVIKPVRIGSVQLDLAFMVVFLAVVILMQVFQSLAVSTA